MPSPPGTATKDFRWPQRRRLLRRADFVAAYEQGMRRASRHFTVFAQARDTQAGDGGPARFGITASRKLGPAVVRNRIRRRTRELLRRLPASLGSGCNVVINPRPSVATDDLAALARELDGVLQLLFAAVGGSVEEPRAPAGGPRRESKPALQAANASDQGKKSPATRSERK